MFCQTWMLVKFCIFLNYSFHHGFSPPFNCAEMLVLTQKLQKQVCLLEEMACANVNRLKLGHRISQMLGVRIFKEFLNIKMFDAVTSQHYCH